MAVQFSKDSDVLYAGATLTTREANYHDDSDFFAVVWDEAQQMVTRVCYATTRCWTYDASATPDATPEVLGKVEAYCLDAVFKLLKENNRDRASRVAIHKLVRSISKRSKKFPIGTEGFTNDPYVDAYGNTVADIDLTDGTRVYGVGVGMMEVVAPEQYYLSDETLMKEAQDIIERWGPVGAASILTSSPDLAYIG